MEFDYKILRGKIYEVCRTQTAFAKAIGLGRTSLSLRLHNKLEFTQDEIRKSCKVLDINVSDIPKYFFTEKV